MSIVANDFLHKKKVVVKLSNYVDNNNNCLNKSKKKKYTYNLNKVL